MITIEQLLESVDLDFEPRWVAMDYCGEIFVFDGRPYSGCERWYGEDTESQCFGKLKLAEFADKPWRECIYEVPRKTTGKIERLPEFDRTEASIFHAERLYSVVNELVDTVNELKGAKNE